MTTTTVTSKREARSTEVMKVFSSEFPGVHFPRRVYANTHPARIPSSTPPLSLFPFLSLRSLPPPRPAVYYLTLFLSRCRLSVSIFLSISIYIYVQVKSCLPATPLCIYTRSVRTYVRVVVHTTRVQRKGHSLKDDRSVCSV